MQMKNVCKICKPAFKISTSGECDSKLTPQNLNVNDIPIITVP